jgi:hypothetical protein
VKEKEKRELFEGGGFLFIIGLVALWQGYIDGALLLCGLGIITMVSIYQEKARAMTDVFMKGFLKLLKLLFPKLF